MIEDYSGTTLGGFAAGHVQVCSTMVGDGWSGYARLKEVKHDPKVVGPMAAHVVLPSIVYHGLRAPHLQRYLDEFVFRFNRRPNAPSGLRLAPRPRQPDLTGQAVP